MLAYGHGSVFVCLFLHALALSTKLINGCVYLCCYIGGVSEHETLGNVECYDPETDRWVVDVIPQMRYRRSGVGVAVLQGLLFAIGGYLEGKTSTDAVECYNPRTKR